MATKWTDAQLNAIEARKSKILVSAAAGSGKTATLIERIIRSITTDTPPMDISRMLIVTFTRAAASELRLRIMKALGDAIQKDPDNIYFRRQMLLLESADISTIDSFCLDVMRSQIKSNDSEYDFRVGDENELKLLRSNAMNDALESVLKSEQFRDRNDGTVYEFFSVLGGTRNDNELIDNLLEIYDEIINTPEGIDYISEYAKELADDSENGSISTRAKEVILAHTKRLFEHFEIETNGYNTAFAFDSDVIKSYGNAISSDLSFYSNVKKACIASDYSLVHSLLKEYKAASLGSLKKENKTTLSEKFVKARTKFKGDINELREKYFGCEDADVKLINQKAIRFLNILYEIFKSYEVLSESAKRSRHIMEFNDLKLGVYKLFCNPDGSATDMAREYSSKYDIIYIDEYQDVDPIQGRIFKALSVNSCLYTVGDIKQSIYGFRGSDPTIFGDLRQSYENYDLCDKADPNGSATVFMSNNFRCSEPIIEASNHVCSYLFKNSDECFSGVGYVDEDDLRFSKGRGLNPSFPVEIVFVDSPRSSSDIESEDDDAEDVSKITNEVLFIKDKITNLIANGTKEDGSPLTYADFAILFDNNKQLKNASDMLTKYGIPCDEAPVENFFSSPEILLLYSLLSVIDNPLREVQLASVLLSPVFGYNDSELCEIQNAMGEMTLYESLRKYSEAGFGNLRQKCRKTLDRLTGYVRKAQILSLDDFISYLWNTLDLNAISLLECNDGRSVEMRRANITKLYDYAIAYTSGIYRTLHEFLSYINELIELNSATLQSDNDTANGNKVHLVTIHRSKGLEFPVCFIFGAGFGNTGKIKIPDVIFESSVGLCFDPAVNHGLARINSPYRKAALARRLEKQRLEKIRLLYVAITRAREQLYITCTKTKTVQRILDNYRGLPPSLSPYIDSSSAYVILRAKSYIEWILFADPYMCKDHIRISEYRNIKVSEENTHTYTSIPEQSHANPQFNEDELRDRLLYDYSPPYPEIPAKLAVSALTPSILDENPVYGLTMSSKEPTFADVPTLGIKEKAKATERGTANHLFLQFCDFTACENGHIEYEINRLTDKGFILAEHARLINKKNIERFFSSSFYALIKKANTVWREQRFNLPLPAHVFSEISSKKSILRNHYVLVQGVIDLIIQTDSDKIILADYKTDYIPEDIRCDDTAIKEMFADRYLRQLSYYALAIKRLFGRYPDSILIYSLSKGKTYELDLDTTVFD